MEPSALAPAVRPHRLWSLDVLRGTCALAVFLCHWHLWSNFAPRDGLERFVHTLGVNCYDAFTFAMWPTGGNHPAVICFFVLSGFCIHYPYSLRARAGQPFPGWKDFGSRRFRRIMPVYWAACLAGLALVMAEAWRPTGSPLLAMNATANLSDLFLRFIPLSGIYPREIFAGNYPLVTVAAEIVIYALYPLIHAQALRGRWVGLGLAFGALQLVAVWLMQVVSPFWVFNSVLMYGLFWYAGALAAHAYVTGRARVSGLGVLGAWLAFLGLKAVPHFYGITLLKQLAWTLVCTLGMLWALRVEERHPGWRDRPAVAAMRFSGKISYSLYSMHTPAILLVSWGLLTFTPTRNYFVQLAASLAASVALTLLAYFAVERVFYRPRVA